MVKDKTIDTEFTINGFYPLEGNNQTEVNQICYSILNDARSRIEEIVGSTVKFKIEEIVTAAESETYDVHFSIEGAIQVDVLSQSSLTEGVITKKAKAFLATHLLKLETVLATGIGILVQGEEI